MKIAVLIKQVPDTWGDRRLDASTHRVDRTDGEQVIDEVNERALELALAYRDTHAGTTVVAVTMGPKGAADSVRKSLAIGADSGVHILDDGLEGADARLTAAAIAGTLGKDDYQLVIAGNVSTDGRGGVLPAMISQHLGIPHLSSLDSVDIDEDAVSGSRTVDSGVQQVRASLPAIVSVTEQLPEARFPGFKSIMAAKKKPVSQLTLADTSASLPGAHSVTTAVTERPARTSGRIVVDDGSAASQLVDLLAAENLL